MHLIAVLIFVCLYVYFLLVAVRLLVSTSAINFVKRIVPRIRRYVLSDTFYSSYSLIISLIISIIIINEYYYSAVSQKIFEST